MNLILNGPSTPRTTWDELYQNEHPKLQRSGIPSWYYEWNLCTDCNNPLSLCKDNPYGIHGEVHKERKALLEAALAQQTASDDSNSSAKEFSESSAPSVPKVKKERNHTRPKLDEAEKDIVLARYDEGVPMTVLAKEYNVPPPYLSAFLKASNRVVKKGRGGFNKSEKAPVPSLEPGMVKAYAERYRNGETVSAFVKESGLPALIISTALKAAGVEITRGRRLVIK